MFPKKLNKDLRELEDHIALLEKDCWGSRTHKVEKKRYGITSHSPPTKDLSRRSTLNKLKKPLRKPLNNGCKSSSSLQALDKEDRKFSEERVMMLANPGSTIEVTVKTKRSQEDHDPKSKEYNNKESSDLSSKCETCSCCRNYVKSRSSTRNRSKSEMRLPWARLLEHKHTKQSDDGHNNDKSSKTRVRPSSVVLKSNNNYTGSVKTSPPDFNKRHDEYKGTKTVNSVHGRERMKNTLPVQKQVISRPQSQLNKKSKFKIKTTSCSEVESVCSSQVNSRDGYVNNCNHPVYTLDNLIKQLQIIAGNDQNVQQLLSDMNKTLKLISSEVSGSAKQYQLQEGDRFNVKDIYDHEVKLLKKGYDSLCKDKEKLLEEKIVKDKLLKSLNNKEGEYLSLIHSMKENIEALTFQHEADKKLLREKNEINKKLQDDLKVMEILRDKQKKLEIEFDEYTIKNEKLKNELRMKELELQKYEILLNNKEIEVNKYKDEIELFKNRVESQYESAKSKQNMDEVKRVMDEIVKQNSRKSNNLSVCKTSWDNNKLIHSSPTSSKSISGDPDESWEKISAINNVNNKIRMIDSIGELDNSGYEGDSSRNSPYEGGREVLQDYINMAAKSFVNNTFLTCGDVTDKMAAVEISSSNVTDRIREGFRMKTNQVVQDLKSKMAKRVLEINDKTFSDISSIHSYT